METIGYIHTASVPEASRNIKVVPVRVNFIFFTNFNWKKLSCSATMVSLFLTQTLALLSVAGQALGFQKEGTQGSQVTNIQRCLQSLGYFNGPVTGKFGPITQNGVIRFQKAHGITADGVLGSRTEQLLQSECHSKTPRGGNVSGELRLGSRGPAVRRLHQDLRQLGFFNGPITSYFGPETQQAVIRFQKSHRIRAIGVVGVRTKEAIRVSLNGNRPSGIGGDKPNGISSGAAGVEVTELQQSLQQLGYFNSNPTGYFGSTTRDAVVRFQQANGIMPNGVADSQTLAAISSALGSQNPDPNYGQNPSPNYGQNYGQNPNCSTDICLGERSQRVTSVQQRLQQWGFFKGDVSGYYGTETQDAVVQFQRTYGIFPTGFVNFQTWQALGISNPDNTTAGNPSPKNRYVVVVPLHNNDTLELVRQYIPEAFAARSRLGAYVNAGQFSERSDAEQLSKALRSRGLDARVEFFTHFKDNG
ncbi:MAG: peptidoglycan-binding protein [Stigonema ocellatum SAG 48.90 = DSM 106950]|nr:peptidoglycan-binding protein [Stigonema ocellatum SAG 48.90 = DSM 106950]